MSEEGVTTFLKILTHSELHAALKRAMAANDERAAEHICREIARRVKGNP